MIFRCNLLSLLLTSFLAYANILIDSDGGYKNIIIGIEPDLRKSDVESLLADLKVLFRNTSEALYIASERKVFFKEILFSIPKEYESWISSKNYLNDENDPKYIIRPNMFITENDIFSDPYTIQHSGCGKQGLKVNIPSEFLRASGFKNKALALVRRWAQYRYGIFDESGFPGDEIYPACYKIVGSDEIKISDCTNKEAVYEFGNKENDLTDVCKPVPATGENDDIISSIMTNIDFPKMNYFCDENTRLHNRNAPTKHNALCREKSTWEIISGHSYFSSTRKDTSNVRPSFKYIIESDPHFIVAVDTSNEMDQNERMILAQNAFSYFLLYDLPHNATIGLMDMKSKEIFTRTVVSENDARWLIGMFPEIDGFGDVCVHCTIQKLLEDLKLGIKDIILITATDISSNWIDNITAMLKSNRVALHVIYFKKKIEQPALLEKIAKDSFGNFYYIPEAFPPGSYTSSLTVLYESFRSIYESFTWLNRKIILVDQMTFSNNCSPKCSMTFPCDSTIETLQVIITGPEFGQSPPILRSSVILDNGVDRFLSGNDSFIYKAEVPAFIITIQNPLARRWSLSFERKPRFNKPVVVIVRSTNTKHGDILNMQSWVSVEGDKNIDSSPRPPITIFSEIKKRHNPVTDVEVVAFVHQASLNTELSLRLKDSGDGDPDIMRNDGIFSRYLTDIKKPGYFSITVTAEKKASVLQTNAENVRKKGTQCCGSFIPDSLAYDSGSFKRVTTYQSFFVGNEMADKNYPPRRIVNLRVDKIEILSNNIKCYILKWTAPGDNYDKGRAISYDLKVFSKREDAWNDFENSNVLTIKMLNIQGPLLEPENAGTIQTAYVELKNLTSGTYYMAMKTTSHSGKISDVSNVVELSYVEANPFTDVGFSKGDYSTNSLDATTVTPSEEGARVALSSNLGLAIGLSCGILFLLIVLGLILFVYFARHKKSKNDPNARLGQSTKKTESNDALCYSPGDGNISIISPVNSWPAGSLISHYETLQRHKTNDLPTPPPKSETDTLSVTSSKYSYDNKIDQNSSIYDPIYYNHIRSQEEINYPYNPGYTPFDPIYTSSLRPSDFSEFMVNPHSSENYNADNYSLNRSRLSRLKTDV